jgi:hypothetical protein
MCYGMNEKFRYRTPERPTLTTLSAYGVVNAERLIKASRSEPFKN